MLVPLLVVVTAAVSRVEAKKVSVAQQRRDYARDEMEPLVYGAGGAFRFTRFQSLLAVKRSFDSVRSSSSFKAHRGEDGRNGLFCSTRLGGGV